MREKINRLPLPAQYVMGGSLTALIFLGAIFSLYAPLWAQRTAVLAQCRQEQARLAQIEKFVLAHPDGDAYVHDVAAQAVLTDTMLPDAPEVPAFMAQAAATAQKNGLRLSAIKPQAAQAQQGFAKLPVEMTVQGSYHGLLGFLLGLQDLPRYTAVTHLDVHAPRPGTPQLEAKIVVEIYTTAVPADNQPGTAAVPSPPAAPPLPLRR